MKYPMTNGANNRDLLLLTMMNTVDMKVSLPVNLSEEDEARVLLAVKLFELGKVSLEQGAKLAGFSKRGFMDVLGRYRVPIFNYSPEELR